MSNQQVEKPKPVVKGDNVYTYVGAGDAPPHVINFMGKQEFVRGEAVEVTDPVLLAKIVNNASFVKGSVDPKTLYKADAEAAKKAEEQRKADAKTHAEFQKKPKTD